MLKKNQLSEKLKKLKIEGADEALHEPETAPVNAPPAQREVLRRKQATQVETVLEPEPADEPILHVKKPEKIAEKKPDEIIEPLIDDKRRLTSMSDLAIPSKKLSRLFKVETSFTETSLSQMLTAHKNTEKVIKWTAKLDRDASEFYSLKEEGLMKMKSSPPVYGMEFDDGVVLATHMGDYTFIMGCYNFDVKTLVKIFAYGIDHAKRFNL